jgi:ubiquinone/menaquinone biosynthesis C-methylase UbiE
MGDRGEGRFKKFPRFAAGLYDRLTQQKAIRPQYTEVAQDLAARVSEGRLLDVGTGPGRLLLEIHKLRPDVQLHGLDISASMVRLARRNLAGTLAEIRQGSIEQTEYQDEFFDVVTCLGSFYLWNNPQRCLEEVFRILKAGQSAYLYETHRDCNVDEVWSAVREKLRDEPLLRRILLPWFLRKQLKMAYATDEVEAIIGRTRFAKCYTVQRITLARVPAWLRISLTKPNAA